MAACTPSIHVFLGRPLFLLSPGTLLHHNVQNDPGQEDYYTITNTRHSVCVPDSWQWQTQLIKMTKI
jgi:hypothetical protein